MYIKNKEFGKIKSLISLSLQQIILIGILKYLY